MPVSRSEMFFLCSGAIAGIVGTKNYERIRAKLAPWLETAGEAMADAYAEAAQRVGQRIEAARDRMADSQR
jgi:hypothetical protein